MGKKQKKFWGPKFFFGGGSNLRFLFSFLLTKLNPLPCTPMYDWHDNTLIKGGSIIIRPVHDQIRFFELQNEPVYYVSLIIPAFVDSKTLNYGN